MNREQLDQARGKLTAATEAMNVAIDQVEAVLREFGFGVRASVPMKSTRGGTRSKHLAFAKADAAWRLIVEVVDTDPGGDVEWAPLRNCPRSERMEGIDLLPKLVTALEQAIEVEVLRVENAKSSAAKFVEIVRKVTADLKAGK